MGKGEALVGFDVKEVCQQPPTDARTEYNRVVDGNFGREEPVQPRTGGEGWVGAYGV